MFLKKLSYSSFATSLVLLLLVMPKLASAAINFHVQNPLAVGSINGLIIAILNIFVVIAVPIIVLFIIFAGFKYVTAQGNAMQVEEATRSLTYAVIGGVLVIGAVAIAEIIKGIVDSFKA